MKNIYNNLMLEIRAINKLFNKTITSSATFQFLEVRNC